MTISHEQTLAANLETSIQALPEVTALYRVGSVLSKIVDIGAQVLALRDDQVPLVRVESSPQGTKVQAAIGIDGAAEAVDVVRRVHMAIEACLTELAAMPAEIYITIVHIDETSNSDRERRLSTDLRRMRSWPRPRSVGLNGPQKGTSSW